MSLKLPWWARALITWAGTLLICAIAGWVLPSDLWTIPSTREEKFAGELSSYQSCTDNCKLFKDGLYLTTIRKDQCEFPHFTGSVSCDIAKECNVDPSKCGGVPKGKLCWTATVVEPENTWSNFGYLLAGLLILFRRPKLLGLAVGANFCLMFLFSGVYHASLQNVPQSLDVSWIYVLLLSMIAYSLQTLRRRYTRKFLPRVCEYLSIGIPLLIGILVAVLKATGNLPSSPLTDSTNVTIFLVVILGVPVLIILLDFWWLGWKVFKSYDDNLFAREFIWKQQWKFELWMFIPALLGGMFRTAIFGLPGDGCGHSLCQPHSAFQAHAAWHILSALALWWVYDFLAQAAFSPAEAMVWFGPEPGTTVAD